MPRCLLINRFSSYKKHFMRRYEETPLEFDPASLGPAEPIIEDQPTMLISDLLTPPAPQSPITPVSLSPSPLGPLDIQASPSSSSIEEEEDGGRTSDPSSPDTIQHVYRCLQCNKAYTSLSALSQHQESHQLPPCVQQTPSKSTEASAHPGFHCQHCRKVYTSLGALKMHIRSHTLPCVCTSCGKAFSRPWLLRGHIRTHTGERPYACPQCKRAFADRSNLRAHMQTHSDVKKYQCESCPRTFSRMSLLNKHNISGCYPASGRFSNSGAYSAS